MTKKDYELLAGVLHRALDGRRGDIQATDMLAAIVFDLTSRLKQDNPNFDVTKFRAAIYTTK